MQTWEKVKFLNIIVLLVIVLSVALPQGVQASSPLDFLFPFLKPPITNEDAVYVGGIKYLPNQEIVKSRTETSKVTYLGSKKYSLDISQAPIHYKDNYDSSIEEWKDIDLTIIDGKITKAPYTLNIDYINKVITVYDKKTGSTVTIGLDSIGGAKVSAQSAIMDKGRVTFKDVALDTDVVIDATNSMVRFKRVLKSDKAPLSANFNLSKSGNGILISYQARDSSGIKGLRVNASVNDGILTETLDVSSGLSYPVEIDPTIDVQVGASAGDIRVYWNGSAWVTDGIAIALVATGYFSNIAYKQGGGYRFLNVTVPNSATINSAYLTLTAVSNLSNDNVNSVIIGDDEDNAAVFSTLADYQARRGTDVGGADNTKRTTASVTWNAIDNWTANNEYQSPSIVSIVGEITTRAGWTSGNAMVLFWDDHQGLSTAVNNTYRDCYAYDGFTTKAAKLHIEYTVIPSIPTTTTNTTTAVEETTCTMNGQIIAGSSVTMRGFAWGTTSNSTLPVNETPPASYTSNYTEVGSFSTGTFSYDKTGLTSGDVYYERAYSYNATGYGWGGEVSFLTKPTEPTGFTCTSNNTAVDLSWTKFVGGTGTVVHTVIRYKANSYPTDIADGTLSYNGTATSHVQTGLTNGTPYYFRGWSWAYDGTLSQYSDTYAGCYSTPYDNFVTTGICSGFGTTYAILNGYLNISGTVTQVGFDYGASSSYGNSVTDTGTFMTGNFDYNLTGLSTASVYHYRAKALLGSTWLYGEDKVFATKGSPVPYEFWNTGGDGDSMKVNSTNVTYQTFTTNTTTIPHSITTVKLMLKKVGSPGTVRVSIRNATDDDISFSGSGNITDTAVLRGFAWGVTNNSTHPYNQVPPATYSTNWTEAGAFIPATFTHSYTLALGETIYARSYSYNATTGYRWDAQSTYSFTPTGSDLVYGDLDGDSFATTYDWQTFTMNTEKCLSANTTYAIVLSCPTGDSSNYVMWQTDSGGGYSGGNGGFSTNSGVSWTPASPVDYLFEVWGNPCLEVADAKVFADYLEDGDWLITLLYKNLFPPYLEQAKDVSELFTLDLVDGTTVIASTKCFDWGYRPGSIYLSASAVTALDWGSDYKVRIQATFSPYPYAEYELQPTDWKGTDLSLLDSWVRSTASLMETYYSSDLTEYIAGRGICLNSSGGVIFSTNIPELDEVRPNLFSIVSGTPINDDEDYVQALQDELAWQTMLGPQITRAFTLGGNLFSIEGSTFGAGIGFIVYLLTCLLCFPAGHAIAAIVIPIPILIILWGTGLAELALMAILLGVAVIIFVWQFWSLRN